ncbi:hypothetical protein N656DRAFT_632283 [Canariomyces notabilis]|uniref:Uncharacterized protein n=1 Tax=Canariomyces notabilis TaxID=2074819 RepID=A0AAN6TG91_9PEZI|nr:hypothetical protein N656DRAFT_632283 [Canariomyces arenarius]
MPSHNSNGIPRHKGTIGKVSQESGASTGPRRTDGSDPGPAVQRRKPWLPKYSSPASLQIIFPFQLLWPQYVMRMVQLFSMKARLLSHKSWVWIKAFPLLSCWNRYIRRIPTPPALTRKHMSRNLQLSPCPLLHIGHLRPGQSLQHVLGLFMCMYCMSTHFLAARGRLILEPIDPLGTLWLVTLPTGTYRAAVPVARIFLGTYSVH